MFGNGKYTTPKKIWEFFYGEIMRRDVLNYLPRDVVEQITTPSNSFKSGMEAAATTKTPVMVMDKPIDPSDNYRKLLDDAGVDHMDIDAQIDKWAAMIPADVVLDPTIPLARQAQIFPLPQADEQAPGKMIRVSRKVERILNKAKGINYDPSDDLTEAAIEASLRDRNKITAKRAKRLVETFDAKTTEVYKANRKQPKRKG